MSNLSKHENLKIADTKGSKQWNIKNINPKGDCNYLYKKWQFKRGSTYNKRALSEKSVVLWIGGHLWDVHVVAYKSW